MLQRFRDLFVGNDAAHGVWDTERGARTERGPATVEDFERHLSGELGLGLVPILPSGVCRFAAIDIDVDTIDHAALYQKVSARRFPLSVCRSKSGGAHLYLFVREPGINAADLITLLKKWSTLLGYPSAEIFPKQARVGPKNLGNWINLPYFAHERTTRYAVGSAGALSLEDFLKSITYYDNTVSVDESLDTGLAQMPPCLAALSQRGLRQGERNSGMFNFAVFFRKSDPEGFETRILQQNALLNDPLKYREVQQIIRSVNHKKYQYTCEQSPIKEFCDRQACMQLPFGVGHMPWQERGQVDELIVANCRKLLTDPPHYIVEVNGRDVKLTSDEFGSFSQFKKRVREKLDLVIAPMKGGQWDALLHELLSKKQELPAPVDASNEGLILEKLHEFLALRVRARKREDLLKGLPFEHDGKVLFRFSDFRRHLAANKLDRSDQALLYLTLRDLGAEHVRLRVSGQPVTVWSFPVDAVEEQTEAFTHEQATQEEDEHGI